MNGRVDSSSRLINADADRIYAAFIDPVAVATWLPPSDMTGTVLAFEPKPGGVMRMELTFRHADHATPGKSSADTDIVEGYFVRLVPAQEVVQRYTFRSDDPAFAGVMTMTWSLEPEGEGTRVTVTAENVPAGIDPQDHETGMNSSLENLTRHTE